MVSLNSRLGSNKEKEKDELSPARAVSPSVGHSQTIKLRKFDDAHSKLLNFGIVWLLSWPADEKALLRKLTYQFDEMPFTMAPTPMSMASLCMTSRQFPVLLDCRSGYFY